MSLQELSSVVLMISLIGNILVMILKPGTERGRELDGKFEEMKDNHEALARRFERHDEIVKNLINALDRLTTRIDRLEPHLKPVGSRRGA